MGAEIARRSPTAPTTTTSRPQARPSFGKPPPPEAPDAPSSPRHQSPAPSRSPGSDQSKKPTPQGDPDQKKMPSGYPSAPPPPPSRREPSTAGSVHSRIRPQRYPSTTVSVHSGIRPRSRRGPPPTTGQDRRWGLEVVRGSPSPSGPTTPSPRSRLHPVETDVEGGAAGPAPPEGGG